MVRIRGRKPAVGCCRFGPFPCRKDYGASVACFDPFWKRHPLAFAFLSMSAKLGTDRTRLRHERPAFLRQTRVEKGERMRWFDDPSSFSLLLLSDLLVKLFHFCPMQLRTKMMLGVISIVEPEEIIDLLVRTYSPGDRLIRISSEVKVITVQIGETVTEVIEGQKDNDKLPVEDAHKNEKANKRGDFHNAPKSILGALPFDFGVNGFRVIAQITQEHIAPNILCFAIMAMPIN